MPDLSRENYLELAEFRFQIRRFLHFSEQQAGAAGIEPQQHQLLLALAGLPQGAQPTVGYLADRLLVRHHSAVELVDRLERLGLVRRETNPKDRRGVLVSLTAGGERILEGLSASHHEELERTGPELAAALRRIMRRTRVGSESAV